jgi:ribosomal protein L11 methyltransferase
VTVPDGRAEEARAVMLELFPEGFEEVDGPDGVELAAYTDAGGEERLWQAFGGATSADVPEDWPDRWRRFHQPVRVGPLWIGPPWESAPPDALAVVIDPGRAFGTGAHPTTRLCLAHLLDLEHRGSVLDIGTGSGVLAIAAAKLGFGPVIALDADPQAVEVAGANAASNGVELDVRRADAVDDAELPGADLALANISVETARALAGRIAAADVVTSGYLAFERPSFPGFRHVARRELDGWAADRFARQTE